MAANVPETYLYSSPIKNFIRSYIPRFTVNYLVVLSATAFVGILARFARPLD